MLWKAAYRAGMIPDAGQAYYSEDKIDELAFPDVTDDRIFGL